MADNIYTTLEGDTFDAVAYRVFGDEHLMNKIISVNPTYVDTVIFEAGVQLIIPKIISTPRQVELPPWFTL